MNRIIFLDIDGVLNSIEDGIYKACNPKEIISLKNLHNKEIIEKSFSSWSINPIKLTLLNQVCLELQANIVIVSTWRKRYSAEEFNTMFKEIDPNWGNWVIAKTPVIEKGKSARGVEVKTYLEENKFSGAYVILDDENNYLDEQLEFCTFTSGLLGLTILELQNVYQKFKVHQYHNITMPHPLYTKNLQKTIEELKSVDYSEKPRIRLK